MRSIARLIGSRILPALLTAMGVVLVTGGLLSYADPNTTAPVAQASFDVATDGPAELPSASASAAPGESPSEIPSDGPPGSPPASIVPEPTPAFTAKPGRQVATRVVIPALNIDMPVIKGNDGYPYCNVAMYLHTANTEARDVFGQPGEGRATYLYAHARDGMFGPIYEHAIRDRTPKKMVGMVVQVYTSDDKLYLYEVRDVRIHAVGAAALEDPINAKTEQLWLQTSEGPRGTPGKTQVIARPISVGDADPADAHPRPRPVTCG